MPKKNETKTREEKNKGGRPSVITEDLISSVLLEISNGASEYSIFKRDDTPKWDTWCKFKVRADADFHKQYSIAKESCYEVWENRIVEISGDDSRDVLETTSSYVNKKGEVTEKTERRSDNTAVNRDRLKVDSMKWIMSKLMSKKYGDKVQQEVTGKDGVPFTPILNIKIAKQ